MYHHWVVIFFDGVSWNQARTKAEQEQQASSKRKQDRTE
jgi:hypothetical protein